MSVMATRVATRGAVFVHSAPVALCPHIAWAVQTVLGRGVRLDWTVQPRSPGSVRAEASWTGSPGTGAELATALRSFANLRYEVVEEPSPGCDGSRWSYTPDLGIHHACLSVHGDSLINEDRLRAALLQHDPDTLRTELERALGEPWDHELEPFRQAGEGAVVPSVHRVG